MSGLHKNILALVACSLAVFCCSTSSFAAGRQALGVNSSQVLPGGEILRNISMGTGKSIIVDLPTEANEVFVADPKIANAIVRSPTKLYIVALENGQTSIFALNKNGAKIMELEISVGRDVAELEQILQTVIPNSDIAVRTVGDTIILTGMVSNASDAEKAVDLAKGFTGSSSVGGGAGGGGGSVVEGKIVNSLTIRNSDQVMLKVTVAEVQRTVLKQLGVNIAGTGGSNSFALVNPLAINGTVSTTAATVVNHLGSSLSLNSVITAFERYGVAHVLAEPTVVAVSGQTAKFSAGGQIPVLTGGSCTPNTNAVTGASTGQTCSNSVTYKDYGVTLNFSPVVLSSGRILLHVSTQVNEIDPSQEATINNTTVPGFRSRSNETTIELPSGGSIATAGLIETRNAQAINGLPGLMNLPILGALFRSRDYQRAETELMIVVTPYIARSVDPQEIVRPDDGFTDPSDPQAIFLGRINRIYATSDNPQLIKNFHGRVGFIND